MVVVEKKKRGREMDDTFVLGIDSLDVVLARSEFGLSLAQLLEGVGEMG